MELSIGINPGLLYIIKIYLCRKYKKLDISINLQFAYLRQLFICQLAVICHKILIHLRNLKKQEKNYSIIENFRFLLGKPGPLIASLGLSIRLIVCHSPFNSS